MIHFFSPYIGSVIVDRIARIGLHIPVRQAQVERRSFARFERFRTADFIRSIVRYRPVAGMDAQPAVARSVRREFLRKEKRRELPRRLSGVRSDPDLVRLGVLRSAREKRERAFVAVAHLDREIFGKFSFGTRQTDFQTARASRIHRDRSGHRLRTPRFRPRRSRPARRTDRTRIPPLRRGRRRDPRSQDRSRCIRP